MKAKHVKHAKSYLVAKNGKGAAQTNPFDSALGKMKGGKDEPSVLGFTSNKKEGGLTKGFSNFIHDRAEGAKKNRDLLHSADKHRPREARLAENPVNFTPLGKLPGFARFSRKLKPAMGISDDGAAAVRTSNEHVATKAKKLAAGARRASEEGAKKSVNLNDRHAVDRRAQDQRIHKQERTEAPKDRRSSPRVAPVHPKQPKPTSLAEFKSRQGSR